MAMIPAEIQPHRQRTLVACSRSSAVNTYDDSHYSDTSPHWRHASRLVRGYPLPPANASVSALGSWVSDLPAPRDARSIAGYVSESFAAGLRPVTLERQIKTSRSRKEFLRLQRDGRIVVSPMLRARLDFYDRVVPINPWSSYRMNTLQMWQSLGRSGYQEACTAPGETRRVHVVPYGERLVVVNTGNSYPNHDGAHLGGCRWANVPEEHLRSAALYYGSPNLELLLDKVLSLDVSSRLATEAAAEMNESVFDLLTELGELPETVKFIYSVLKEILTLFKSTRSKILVRRRNANEVKQAIDEISSLWLQWRYAVQPLVHSVVDAMDLINHQYAAYQTVRKRADQTLDLESNGWQVHCTISERVWGKSRLDLSAGVRGLGMDPLVTLWELTPLSFVVDWVLPIGQFLASLGSPSGTVEHVFTRSLRINAPVTFVRDDVVVGGNINLYQIARFDPQQFVGLSTNVNMTWKRVIDASALSWTLFLKSFWKSKQ